MYLSEKKMADQTIPTIKPSNPLSSYFRQPKLYISLPSKGQFYPEGALDISANGEYAVYAMTAKDELIMKTPDALMNGQATVEVIKSCVPAIKEPWFMPSIDLDAVLIAMRVATYGGNMDVSASCPSCSHDNEYELNLMNHLEKASSFAFNSAIEIHPLVINIKPYNYKEVTKAAIKSLEQQKLINIVTDQNLSEEEKLSRFGESFVALTKMTVDVVADSIDSIQTPDTLVKDRNQIKEFIDNAPAEIFNAVNNRLVEIKNNINLQAQDVKCGECGWEYSFELTMDQTDFFGKGS
jgi:hypothetical protein